MSYDLFLQSHPGPQPPAPAGSWSQAVADHHPAIAACEITPLGGEPEDLHVDYLEGLLESGEASVGDFLGFCSTTGLEPDLRDPSSAAAFLASRDGSPLAIVHLPREETNVKMVYSALVLFALEHGIRLVDPQLGADVDLTNPGDVPPFWR